MFGKEKEPMLYKGYASRQGQDKGRNEKAPSKGKVTYRGTGTIYVTSLKHGNGCSYFSLILANFLTEYKGAKTSLVQANGITVKNLISDKIDVFYYPCDLERVYSQNYDFIVRDGGVLDELEEEEEKDLNRADIKIMMCWPDEDYLRKLAFFIQNQSVLSNWYFMFNMVPATKKSQNASIMEDYSTFFLPCIEVTDLDKKLVTNLYEIIGKG